jgi:hypothetical protein
VEVTRQQGDKMRWKKVAKTVAGPKNAKNLHQPAFKTLKYQQYMF